MSPEFWSVSLSTFALIALAEVGDKSQLVCVTLAARHRAWPVALGAAAAFLILNTLAVVFGAGIALWVPERVMAGIVALLFAVFGLHALRAARGPEAPVEVSARAGRSLFLTALLLIFVAEFGDKTQLAVAALAGGFPPWPVWAGATAALILVSAGGAWAGYAVLRRLPIAWLHRIGGALFLAFAALALWRALA